MEDITIPSYRTKGPNLAKGFRSRGEFNDKGNRFYFEARARNIYFEEGEDDRKTMLDFSGEVELKVYRIVEGRVFSPGFERVDGLPLLVPVLFREAEKRRREIRVRTRQRLIVGGSPNKYHRAVLAQRLQNYVVNSKGLVDKAFETIDKEVMEAYQSSR